MKHITEVKAVGKDALIAEPVLKDLPLRHVKDMSTVGEDGAIRETFRVTDSGVDREGDVILSSGMDTKVYEAAGSLLWGHRADLPELVLGCPEKIMRNETSIDITFRFATKDENPMGAMVGRMVRSGLVRGVSVGILIEEFSEATDRGGFMPLNIVRSELLEVSVTPIPSNSRALWKPAEVVAVDPTQVAEDILEEILAEAQGAKAVENSVSGVASTDPLAAAFINAIRQK